MICLICVERFTHLHALSKKSQDGPESQSHGPLVENLTLGYNAADSV